MRTPIGFVDKKYTGRVKYKRRFFSHVMYAEVSCTQVGWIPYAYTNTYCRPRRYDGDVWTEWVEVTEEVVQEVFELVRELRNEV